MFTLTGDFRALDGDPAAVKSLTIATNLTTPIVDTSGNVIFDSKITVPVVDGVFSVDLPAPSEDMLPEAWGFIVSDSYRGREWRVVPPLDGYEVSLAMFTDTTPLPIPPSLASRVAALEAGGVGGGTSGPVAWTSITGKPSTFAPSTHTHAQSDVTGLATALSGKASAVHTHGIADTTGLQAALDGKAAVDHTHTAPTWSQVTGKPSTFPPAAHNHDGVYVKPADLDVRNGIAMSAVYVTTDPDTDPNIADLPLGTVVIVSEE